DARGGRCSTGAGDCRPGDPQHLAAGRPVARPGPPAVLVAGRTAPGRGPGRTESAAASRRTARQPAQARPAQREARAAQGDRAQPQHAAGAGGVEAGAVTMTNTVSRAAPGGSHILVVDDDLDLLRLLSM